MSTLPSPHLRLPWELIILACKEADPSTLAVLGRVSHDLLVVAGPQLYKSVYVKSLDQLGQLFCARTTQQQDSASRINALLSLSQMRTLSIDVTTPRPTSRWAISTARLDASQAILLEDLRLTYNHNRPYPIRLLFSTLLPYLNPARCCHDIEDGYYLQGFPVLLGESVLRLWTRLQELELRGSIPVIFDRDEGTFLLGGLPNPTLDSRRVVRFVAGSPSQPGVVWSPYSIADSDGIIKLDLMQDRSVVLVARSKEEKATMEAEIRDLRLAEWKRVLTVELSV